MFQGHVACRNLTLTESQLYAKRMEVNHNKNFGDTMVVLDRRVLQPNGENWVNTRNISGMLLKLIVCEKLKCKQEHLVCGFVAS